MKSTDISRRFSTWRQTESSRHRRSVIALLFGALCLAPAASHGQTSGSSSERERIVELLHQVPFFDGHNDIPWQYRTRVQNRLEKIDFRDTTELHPPMHTDLERLAKSAIGAEFWSVYVPTDLAGPAATTATLEQIDVVHRLAERYPESLEIALTTDDVVRIHAQGKIASLIGVEGGHSIASSLGVLRQLYLAGARYMTLTHSKNTTWADSATDQPQHGGLSEFGMEVVREMNRLGMLVDLSHVSPQTMDDALDIAEAPVIFSHSSTFALTRHARNVADDVLERLPDNGGVVMVTFVPSFVSEKVRLHGEMQRAETQRLARTLSQEEATRALEVWRSQNPAPRATLSDIADHVDHVRQKAGIDHIGIGSDFDGIFSVPLGLEDVSKMPDLFVELSRRGYSDQELKKIASLNLLRVMRSAEATAWKLRSLRPPSDRKIDDQK